MRDPGNEVVMLYGKRCNICMFASLHLGLCTSHTEDKPRFSKLYTKVGHLQTSLHMLVYISKDDNNVFQWPGRDWDWEILKGKKYDRN